jgi:hypothetical protein
MRGVKRAILYGFAPHNLGFCGPKEKQTKKFLNYLKTKKEEKKIRKIFENFEGAYSYYELIAKKNGIKDPFNERVVEAYWLGNELLDKVDLASLKELVRQRFSRPGLLPRKVAEEKAKNIPAGSLPHHSFHVLIIGSVTGRVKLSGKLLDICRVGWGRVVRIMNYELGIKNNKTKVLVKYRPLVGEKKLRLGKPINKELDWNKNLASRLKKGDWVSFHWNQVCEVLTKDQVRNLEKYTKRNISAHNYPL